MFEKMRGVIHLFHCCG